ncbi:ComEA family DNA-binding protein [Leifsonia sp. 1010]|uniref:ComEA family DNA-binding protein n=1 Tax=Leifsonia sp. 1010 TaxID=2817769 RepID=UPI00285E7462|nr:ComEA family DNA-binding protein [Leifsonia sp. 1010]MDR6613197.1 competence protein ComEA [Leifsonia sp. 1010]
MRHRAEPSAVGFGVPERSGSEPVPDVRAEGSELTDTAIGPASRRVRIGVGAAIVLAIVAAVVAVLLSSTAQQGTSVDLGATDPPSAGASGGASSGTPAGGGRLLLHVTGAVREPGLVDLPAGSRVVDAVAAAGGAADDADIAAVNLARPVADGEQLVVPRIGDPPPVGGPASSGSSAGTGGAGGATGAPVNLNTATPTELETLPRIGPTLAQRIVDWRAANGRFGAVTDLLKVSGIGQKLFDGLMDRVVV